MIKDLSCEQIYSLVWERPLSRIGPEIGLDGPRLAQLCCKLQIPYPPRGYWQKKAVGRAPNRTPLLPFEEINGNIESIKTRSGSRSRRFVQRAAKENLTPKSVPVPNTSSSKAVKEIVQDDQLDPLQKLHPKIKELIEDHKREQRARSEQSRRTRNGTWYWSKPVLHDLTERDLYRLRASSTLCNAIEKAGGAVKDARMHGELTFVIDGRELECIIKEKMSRPIKSPDEAAAKWTAYPHDHNTGLISSGFLRANIKTWLPYEQPQWVERPKKPFSLLIPLIVGALFSSVPRLVEWERKREEDHRRFQEEQQRRWELKRIKEIDEKRWDRFRSSASSWQEKRLLDTFIVELERRLVAEGNQEVGEKTINQWLDWARNRAAQLDPFSEGLAGLFNTIQREKW
jgi:hypothetical protein